MKHLVETVIVVGWMVKVAVLPGARVEAAVLDRIPVNGQGIFASGMNLAYVDMGKDVGPGILPEKAIAEMLLATHDAGGNTARIWIHADGVSTPEFNSEGEVVGPGSGTTEDLVRLVELAAAHEVVPIFCLWSFDMLKSGDIERNRALLTSESHMQSYFRNALTPMVNALKGRAIIWEIFNEAESMTNDVQPWGADTPLSVSIHDVQRFVNRATAVIRRADPGAQVTTGAKAMYVLTDEQVADQFGIIEKQRYSDHELIEAGGEPEGTLSWYSVHFYAWESGVYSPFVRPASFWGLDKPLVVAEFFVDDQPDATREQLYRHLLDAGYAGALAWQFADGEPARSRMAANMRNLWEQYREDVDLHGEAGDWPLIAITAPGEGASFPACSTINIDADAVDPDGSISRVRFLVDGQTVAERLATPYRATVECVGDGYRRITAEAADNQGHRRESLARIKVGTPPLVVYEAEDAALSGPVPREDRAASGGACVSMTRGSISWTVTAEREGRHELRIGYLLPFSYKEQFLSVNGVRVQTLAFDGEVGTWLELRTAVSLARGENTIRIESSWGYMHFDHIFLTVPANTPPRCAPVADQTVIEGQDLAFEVACDDEDGDAVTISVEGELPAHSTFNQSPGSNSGTFSWRPQLWQAGEYAIAFTAYDGETTSAPVTASIAVNNLAGPFFTDEFSHTGTVDPEWQVLSGTWRLAGGTWRSTSTNGVNMAAVTGYDAAFPVSDGIFTVRMKLAAGAEGNGRIVFATQGADTYRYVGIAPGKVTVGQEGTLGGIGAGVKRTFRQKVAGGRWYAVKAKVFEDGRVVVWLGKTRLGSYRFTTGAVVGGIGLAAAKTRTVFDHYAAAGIP